MVERIGMRIVAIETRVAGMVALAQQFTARAAIGLMARYALARLVECERFWRTGGLMEHMTTATRPARRRRYTGVIRHVWTRAA